MIEAYTMLNKLSGLKGFNRAFKLFNSTAILVCKGQQMDLDFENQNSLTLKEYLQMIECLGVTN